MALPSTESVALSGWLYGTVGMLQSIPSHITVTAESQHIQYHHHSHNTVTALSTLHSHSHSIVTSTHLRAA